MCVRARAWGDGTHDPQKQRPPERKGGEGQGHGGRVRLNKALASLHLPASRPEPGDACPALLLSGSAKDRARLELQCALAAPHGANFSGALAHSGGAGRPPRALCASGPPRLPCRPPPMSSLPPRARPRVHRIPLLGPEGHGARGAQGLSAPKDSSEGDVRELRFRREERGSRNLCKERKWLLYPRPNSARGARVDGARGPARRFIPTSLESGPAAHVSLLPSFFLPRPLAPLFLL